MPDYVLILKYQLRILHNPINFVGCYFLLIYFFLSFIPLVKNGSNCVVLLLANVFVPGNC